MNEKIKGGLFYLGTHFVQSRRGGTEFRFDEGTWNDIVNCVAENGMNHIFWDIHEGLKYGSHPELALKDSWTRQKMRREIKRLKELGITITPGVNFSSCHDVWLGPYELMMGTPKYYQVCRDIIFELCDLFEDTPYMHLGLDEEDERHSRTDRNFVAAYRQGDMLWHDLQFFMDCVRDCKKTPVMWGSTPIYRYEEFKANIEPEDLVLMHYYYHGVREEHWIRTDSREDYNKYYNINGPYVGMGMEILERDDPFYIHFRKNALRSAQDGYDVIMACSNYYLHEHNADDVVEMMINDWPEERVKGIITVPWKPTLPEYRDHHIDGINQLSRAFKKFGY